MHATVSVTAPSHSHSSSSPSVRPPPLISIASRTGHAFEPHTMIRGLACHARGVEIKTSNASHVQARVRSKRSYDVELHAEQKRRLIAGCTCPARSMGVNVCKHVWAALLEVDRSGGLEELRQARGNLEVIPAPLSEPAPAAALLESQMGDAIVKERGKEKEKKTKDKTTTASEPAPKKMAKTAAARTATTDEKKKKPKMKMLAKAKARPTTTTTTTKKKKRAR